MSYERRAPKASALNQKSRPKRANLIVLPGASYKSPPSPDVPALSSPCTRHEYPALPPASIRTEEGQVLALSVERRTVVWSRPVELAGFEKYLGEEGGAGKERRGEGERGVEDETRQAERRTAYEHK